MKVRITVEPNEQNLMEFDVKDSGLTEKELLENVILVAKEWLERINADRT